MAGNIVVDQLRISPIERVRTVTSRYNANGTRCNAGNILAKLSKYLYITRAVIFYAARTQQRADIASLKRRLESTKRTVVQMPRSMLREVASRMPISIARKRIQKQDHAEHASRLLI